jgi:kynurenine formamidase
MPTYIDLSHTIENEMPVHLFDDGVKLYQNKFLEKDKFNNTRLETGMHVGTHIDIPSHLLNCDLSADILPVERFIGNGCLLDVRNETVIKMKEVYKGKIKENDIVLLYTGHDRNYGSQKYYEQAPVVDKEFAEFLIAKQIKMLGMDLPAPDKYPFEIHKMLFQKNIYIMENMTNLELLRNIEVFEMIAFPIKIKAEAALVRAVARF